MSHPLLGFFSGFPERRFPRDIAERVGDGLAQRRSLVFISAWLSDGARNDDDSAGMYRMFEEYGIDFDSRHVIDDRTEASRAVQLVSEASCIFLIGGHPGRQRALLREKQLEDAIRESSAVVLGVSAGAINMAKRSLDTKESPVPYDGLGLADITVKPHFDPENKQVLETLLRISNELPICAIEDNGAIFVADGCVTHTGQIHLIDKGSVLPFELRAI